MKRPDLLILVAVWQFINAFLALVGIFAIGSFVLGHQWYWWQMGMGMGAFPLAIMSIGVLCLIAFLGIAVAGGIGLLTGKEWGRILSIVHAALNLFSVPVGTLLGILALIYLIRADVKEYFEAGA